METVSQMSYLIFSPQITEIVGNSWERACFLCKANSLHPGVAGGNLQGKGSVFCVALIGKGFGFILFTGKFSWETRE